MLEQRNIIYFDPFYFKNGNTAKPKYFVVLTQIDNKSVIASHPTRKDTIPSSETIESGCLELPEINLNCFVIPTNVAITECGKSFTFITHMYGHQIDEYKIDLLQEIYPNEGSDYVVWGKMKLDIFTELIKCFKSSKSTKRKFKKTSIKRHFVASTNDHTFNSIVSTEELENQYQLIIERVSEEKLGHDHKIAATIDLNTPNF